MLFRDNFNAKIARGVLAGALLLLGAGCGGGKGPGPTPTGPPQISCPADVTVREVPGLAQEVTYPAPTTSSGAPPVTATCAPASGTSFTLGATPVTCTARDAQAREASCSFRVNVTGFALGAKKFEALGDSLTEGENGRITAVDMANAYPTKLQASLDMFYPGQGMVVVNRGQGGERIEETRDRMPGYLSADRPDAVLLLGGYNNLNVCSDGQADAPKCEDAVDQVVGGIRDCIHRAKESPVGIKYVFVSTLTPPGTGPKRIDGAAIFEANRRIRLIVAAERVTLVDSHPAFRGHEPEYVSPDGLHLNPAGYQALADLFLAAIRTTIPQTPQLR